MILQGGSVEQLISTNSNHFKFRYPNEYLGGNSNIFEIFTPNFGEDGPILTNFHIFQMGWGTNHQPDMCSYPEPLNFTLIECRKLYKDQRLQSWIAQPPPWIEKFQVPSLKSLLVFKLNALHRSEFREDFNEKPWGRRVFSNEKNLQGMGYDGMVGNRKNPGFFSSSFWWLKKNPLGFFFLVLVTFFFLFFGPKNRDAMGFNIANGSWVRICFGSLGFQACEVFSKNPMIRNLFLKIWESRCFYLGISDVL